MIRSARKPTTAARAALQMISTLIKPRLLMSTVLALIAIGVAACGSASTSRSSHSPSAPGAAASSDASGRVPSTETGASEARVIGDKDNDDSALPDDENRAVRDYGHPADAAQRRSITALLEGYYAIALAGNGAKACSMISASLVKAVPLDYGKLGPSYLHGGKTCTAVLALLFTHEHRLLATEVPHLLVRDVRLQGAHGLALLAFGAVPEREIDVRREGHTWKLEAPLDRELP
jgi:hypothetical protein